MAKTLAHLESKYISEIVLRLNDDVYGANGELDEFQIKRRLIETIHARTDYAYTATDMMPVWLVADIVREVWGYMDRQHVETIATCTLDL
jgi:hypothetical protein